jgi:hypothetical protein
MIASNGAYNHSRDDDRHDLIPFTVCTRVGIAHFENKESGNAANENYYYGELRDEKQQNCIFQHVAFLL